MDKLAIGVGTVAILITPVIVASRFKSKLKQLHKYGVLGIFLACVIGNITPGATVLLTMVVGGRYYAAWVVGAVGALGALLGEFLLYNMGTLGQTALKDHHWVETAQRYIDKFGFFMIIIITAIPTPFYNIAAVVSGAMHYSVWLFLTAAFLGQWLKYSLYAAVGVVTTRIV